MMADHQESEVVVAVQGRTAVKVLLAMTDVLGVPSDGSRKTATIPWDVTRNDDDEDEEDACDFSSFPGLSLEHPPSEPSAHDRKHVAEHVAHLLERPVLVSNNSIGKDDEHPAANNGDDDEALMEATMDEVPLLMHTNMYKSFSTLVESRLRTYARFLAQHGRQQGEGQDAHNNNNNIGVDEKLEAMMELGALLHKESVSTHFEALLDQTICVPNEGEEEEALRVCMPVIMRTHVHLSIPNLATNEQEHLAIPLRVFGTLTGIFSMAKEESTTPLLRVADLNVNVYDLVADMARQASAVVNKIVDMANDLCAFRQQWVPANEDEQEGMVHAVSQDLQELMASKKRKQEEDDVAHNEHPPSPKKKRCSSEVAVVPNDEGKELRLPIVSPTVGATFRIGNQPPSIPDLSLAEAQQQLEEEEDDDDEALPSPEHCGKIVDYVFSDSQPTSKKARLDDPEAEWAVIPDLH